jgi:hypothetical protein
MEFTGPDFSFGLQFDRVSAAITRGYLFVNNEKMYRLHKNGPPLPFYETLAAVCEPAGVTGGFGGFEAGQTPAPAEQVLSRLLTDPARRDHWFDVHVATPDLLAGTGAQAAWSGDFQRVDARGYVFFVNRGFLALAKKFG